MSLTGRATKWSRKTCCKSELPLIFLFPLGMSHKTHHFAVTAHTNPPSALHSAQRVGPIWGSDQHLVGSPLPLLSGEHMWKCCTGEFCDTSAPIGKDPGVSLLK